MSKATKREILCQFAFFDLVPERLQRRMLEAGMLVELPIDRNYYHEGDVCEQVALVGSGQIRVYKIADSGREITLYSVQAGEMCIINVSCMVSDQAFPASAVVEVPVQALVYSKAQFREWMEAHSELQTAVFRMLSMRLVGVMSLVENIAFRKIDARLAEFLFQQMQAQGPELALTHDHIAREIGTAREVVSRTLQRFAREHILSLSRAQIRIDNPPALKKAAAGF